MFMTIVFKTVLLCEECSIDFIMLSLTEND
jgi:hypothetical protein